VLAIAAAAAAVAQEDRWKGWMDRGSATEIAGDYAGALAAYGEAAELVKALGSGDPRRVMTYNAQGMMYDALGRFADSDAAYRRALEALDAGDPGPSMNRAVLLANMANVSLEMGHAARAESLLRESVAIHTALRPADDLRLSLARNSLAELLTVTNRLAEAATLLETSLASLEKLPESGTELGIALNNLGAVRLYQGRWAEAQTHLERSVASLEAARGTTHPILLRSLHNLAIARYKTGQPRSAGDTWRRAVDLAERTVGIEHPLFGEILGNYAVFLRETGDKATGKALAQRSASILRDHRRRNGLGSVVDVKALRQGPR
jgi:tetratricopeptide (TPR) repeat protein